MFSTARPLAISHIPSSSRLDHTGSLSHPCPHAKILNQQIPPIFLPFLLRVGPASASFAKLPPFAWKSLRCYGGNHPQIPDYSPTIADFALISARFTRFQDLPWRPEKKNVPEWSNSFEGFWMSSSRPLLRWNNRWRGQKKPLHRTADGVEKSPSTKSVKGSKKPLHQTGEGAS